MTTSTPLARASTREGGNSMTSCDPDSPGAGPLTIKAGSMAIGGPGCNSAGSCFATSTSTAHQHQHCPEAIIPPPLPPSFIPTLRSFPQPTRR